MDAATGVTSAKQSLADTNNTDNSLGGLNTDSFLKLMIAQLQNQDPLNPADNNELLQQVNQIRNIGATDKLTSTLDAVLTGQNVSSATALIGKHIKALSDTNTKIEGVVDRVTITDGVAKLHVGDDTVDLNNISDILPNATAS